MNPSGFYPTERKAMMLNDVIRNNNVFIGDCETRRNWV
jgi:hypothetical protein